MKLSHKLLNLSQQYLPEKRFQGKTHYKFFPTKDFLNEKCFLKRNPDFKTLLRFLSICEGQMEFSN